MGDELGRATVIDRLLVSSGLFTPIFTLTGNDDVGAVIRNLCHNVGTMWHFPRNLGYIGEIEPDSQNVWTCVYTIGPGSVLPISMSYGSL